MFSAYILMRPIAGDLKQVHAEHRGNKWVLTSDKKYMIDQTNLPLHQTHTDKGMRRILDSFFREH